jgi:hypothetical protein
LRDGYRVCGGCEGAAGPRHAKTSSPGRKTVPGPSRDGADEGGGEETSGSETRLTWLLQDRLGASPAVYRGNAGCQAWRPQPAADGNHLILRPNSDGEGVGATVQDCVGAVVEPLKGVETGRPDGPRRGGRRAAQMAARWAGSGQGRHWSFPG